MKHFFGLVLVLLLVMIFGCSDESLMGVEEPLAPETVATPAAAVWLEPAQAIPFNEAEMNAALAGGDMVLQMGAYTFAPDPAVSRVLRCLDATGTLVHDLTLPERFVLEGRIQHLGRVTGYFGGGTCLANADFSLTVTRDWGVTAPNGEAIFGTYTATVQPDGSFTSEDVVTGGIGRFAGATGRGRSAGSVDLETGEGTLYTKGLVSAPKEVVEMGFVVSLSPISESGSVSCLNSNGDQVFVGTERFEAVGLATYLGEITATIVNDRCISYQPGVLTFYGSTTYTGPQGDALYVTYTVLIGVGDTWPNASIITGGTGRFEGVTGWMNGMIDPDAGGVADLEGLIFMPR